MSKSARPAHRSLAIPTRGCYEGHEYTPAHATDVRKTWAKFAPAKREDATLNTKLRAVLARG